jgi:hypothetical protein
MPAIAIRDCSECVDRETSRVYTADSFEMVFSWVCSKADKLIAKYVETFDPNPKIPEWCPRKE